MPPKRKGAAASKVAAKKLKKEATANTASEEVKEVEAKLVPSGAPVKHYIGAQQLLQESYQLALQILKSGYRPNYIVGVWRGGTPIGISVQEYLEFFGVTTDHIAIRTSSYYGIGQQSKTVRVHGLGYIIEKVNADDRLLIVDDVFDSGLSLQAAVSSQAKFPVFLIKIILIIRWMQSSQELERTHQTFVLLLSIISLKTTSLT
jgi:hypoxanthine phosphoribosyltransferase